MKITRYRDHEVRNMLFIFNNGTEVFVHANISFGETFYTVSYIKNGQKTMSFSGDILKEIFTKIRHQKIKKVMQRLAGNYMSDDQINKAINLGLNYGMTPNKLREKLGLSELQITQENLVFGVNYGKLEKMEIAKKQPFSIKFTKNSQCC